MIEFKRIILADHCIHLRSLPVILEDLISEDNLPSIFEHFHQNLRKC